jgi:tyrosyl-tRNA synthetase
MIRKVIGPENRACCFSVPLLLKPDGTKFGKSENGAIFIDPEITNPFEMYQFFYNQPDAQIDKLLKTFTFLAKDEIIKVIKNHQRDPKLRIGQKELAKQVITDIHGKKIYDNCCKISNALYGDALHELSDEELYAALSSARKFKATKASYNIIDLLLEIKLISSKSEGRKLIEQKAISVNGKVVSAIDFHVEKKQAIKQNFSYIKKGKKDYTLIDFKSI